jgi:hypothetical protein
MQLHLEGLVLIRPDPTRCEWVIVTGDRDGERRPIPDPKNKWVVVPWWLRRLIGLGRRLLNKHIGFGVHIHSMAIEQTLSRIVAGGRRTVCVTDWL